MQEVLISKQSSNDISTQSDTQSDTQPPIVPVNSAVAIPSPSMNRTYLQCYSREANNNLVSWADQMSIALRDSVAHLDQICMRVRSCLSDLEANEIRYLHMQRRPSPLQAVPLFAGILDKRQDDVAHKELELEVTEPCIGDPGDMGQSTPLIEIESLPADTPVIVEPLAVQEIIVRPPSRNTLKRPKSRRSANSSRGSLASTSRPVTSVSLEENQKNMKCPSGRNIATVKSLKPILSVREHLELTKEARTSSRRVYKKIFRNKLAPKPISPAPTMRLPTPTQLSKPKTILKQAQMKFGRKTLDVNIKMPVTTASTVENTMKNKENTKFNDSLWFKENKAASQNKLHDKCGCKVIVECPRVPIYTTPRSNYNAHSRLQWIRAKNSLVLEYGRTHAADNQPQCAIVDGSGVCGGVLPPPPPPPPPDILDAINNELVRPLCSEYPRRDGDIGIRGGLRQSVDGEVGDNELLRELLHDPHRLKSLVQSTSRRNVSHKAANSLDCPLRRRHPHPSSTIKQFHSQPFNSSSNSPYTMQELLQMPHQVHHKKKKKKHHLMPQPAKQLKEGTDVRRVLDGTMGDGKVGDLMVEKDAGGRDKELEVRRSGLRSANGSRSGRVDKENFAPLQQKPDIKNIDKGNQAPQMPNNWSTMTTNEIRSKLTPYMIPVQRTYTVLPVTEIIYDKKPPIPGLPATTVMKGVSSAHLNSTQPSACNVPRRCKPRSLYTDVQTQRKLDAYLELRDISAYYKPANPIVYTTLPAVTITTPPNFNGGSSHCSARHTAHPHHHYHPRRQQSTDHHNQQQQQLAPSRGTINSNYHRRTSTDANVGVPLSDKAKRAKAAISAATRRDIGSSIQQLEDKIAELISDPSKIGDGKAFDDVEKDIVRMLNKISPSKEDAATEVSGIMEDTVESRVSNSPNADEDSQVEMPRETISTVMMKSAINLTESTQMTDIAEMMNKTTQEAQGKVIIIPKSYTTCDNIQPKKYTPVPYDALEITAGLKQVERILDPNQQNITKSDSTTMHKSPRKESPPLQPIYESIETINNNNRVNPIVEHISQIGAPRKVFKIENIPEFVNVDSLNQLSNFPYVTNIKKQNRDDLADSKISVSGPELKRLKKLDGTSGKPEQDLMMSTDNLCSIDSDQFVTPFMQVVRKYRKEDTHDNFMQFLEALTQLSQDNGIVLGDTKRAKLEIKDFSTQDLSNPFYKDMKEAQIVGCSKYTTETTKLATPQSPTFEVMYGNGHTDISLANQTANRCLREAKTAVKKSNSICSQIVECILKRCKNYADKRLMLQYRPQPNRYRCKASTTRGLLVRFLYIVLFATVFMAMTWNWNCIS